MKDYQEDYLKNYTRNDKLYNRLLKAAGDDKLPVLDENKFQMMNDEYGKEDMRKNLADYIATERPVFPLKDIYLKGTPIHVRGSLLYNNLLKKHKLSKYETIQSGDKIKFISLKEPNTLRENVISFSNQLPKEFKLHQYIDYDEMFTKSFLEPLRFIVNAIGWNFEKKSNLDEFF